jgi:hypothetical protein
VFAHVSSPECLALHLKTRKLFAEVDGSRVIETFTQLDVSRLFQRLVASDAFPFATPDGSRLSLIFRIAYPCNSNFLPFIAVGTTHNGLRDFESPCSGVALKSAALAELRADFPDILHLTKVFL